jgi:hypothetical protein
MADASLNAEMGINDRVREGRMAGAAGMSGAEGALQNQRMQSITGAAGMDTQLEGNIFDRNRYGQEGLLNRAESDRGAAMSAASANSANDRWNQQFQFGKQMAGLEGMHSLYDSSEGGYGRGLDYDLSNRGVNQGSQGGNIDRRMQNNPQTSWKDYIGAGAGIAGGFI